MKKCSNCGRLETDSTGFCPDCGSPNFEPLIKDDSTNINQTQAPASAPESAFDSLKSQDTPFEATASPFEANSTPNPFATPQPAQPQGTGENYSYNAQTPNGAYSVNANQNAYANPNGTYNTTVTGTVTRNPGVVEEDKANVGLVILSVFIPIVGIILWAVKKKETPKAAKSYGLAGLIVFIVNFVLSIIISIAMFAGSFAVADRALDSVDNFVNNYDGSYSENYRYPEGAIIPDDETKTETEKATESSATSTVKFASDNWIDFDKMQFAYNNKVYTLGETTLQEMIDDGIPFESDSVAHFDDAVDKDSESSLFYITLKHGGDEWAEFYVRCGNFTTSTKKARELPITSASYDAGYEGNGNIEKELRFVIPYTTTAQELKNKYGEPSYFYDGSSFDVYEYSQESKQYYNDREYHFEFEDEGLTNIELNYIP